VTEDGFTVQLAKGGAPEQASATAEVNPPTGFIDTLKLSVLPSVTFCTAVGPVNPKSGGVFEPLPVRGKVCGLVLSPSVRTRLAVSAPTIDGLKVTLTVQEAPAAMLAPHVLAEMA
jgi:hypothetical protein